MTASIFLSAIPMPPHLRGICIAERPDLYQQTIAT